MKFIKRIGSVEEIYEGTPKEITELLASKNDIDGLLKSQQCVEALIKKQSVQLKEKSSPLTLDSVE